DWRVSSQFTLNYGLRFEHESGLRERDNHITVGFDPNATSPELQAIDAAIRKNGYTGPTLKGGLMFAGVNGAHDYQGNPPAVKVSPRVGATWAFNPNTVVRGGYGLFFAPWQYTQQSQGTIGYMGSTGRDIGFGGFTNTGIEINQIDPATLPKDASGRWDAAALRRSVPNPFFGVPGAGELGTSATILAGQLLRPFPQFANITKFQQTEAVRRQYHA